MKTVIFDIDGTIADISHRRAFLEGVRPDWHKFNAAMGDDTPNKAIVLLYKTLWESGQYEINLFSGRNECFRRITEQWLIWNEIPFNQLYLRADKDQRSDDIVKQEMLDHLLAMGKQVAFVVDDRQQVVDMWRRNGITCLQCDVGDF